jgi:hypothetical protein
MLPNGNKLSDEQAMLLAQYSKLADVNPFRGEVYLMPNGSLVDGYKALTRWARDRAPYSDKYTELTSEECINEGLGDEDIAYRCSILRDDKKDMLLSFTQAGATFQDAFDLVATEAIGVVTKKDRTGQRGEIDPPKGWTWHQVAKKRALKNALNLSHGAPSPQELARLSWQVGQTTTQAEDWSQIPAHIAQNEELAAGYAALQAQARERIEADGDMTKEDHEERLERNVEVLRGDQSELEI